jgi:hypothetical protein
MKPDVLSKFGNSIRTKLSDYYGSPFRPASQDLRDQLIFELVEVVQQAKSEVAREIEEQLLSPELLEIGRKAIEDTLIEWRDNRLSEFTRGNGLVIRERNGKDSSMIRFGPETALRIGINAMWKSLISKYLQEKS